MGWRKCYVPPVGFVSRLFLMCMSSSKSFVLLTFVSLTTFAFRDDGFTVDSRDPNFHSKFFLDNVMLLCGRSSSSDGLVPHSGSVPGFLDDILFTIPFPCRFPDKINC